MNCFSAPDLKTMEERTSWFTNQDGFAVLDVTSYTESPTQYVLQQYPESQLLSELMGNDVSQVEKEFEMDPVKLKDKYTSELVSTDTILLSRHADAFYDFENVECIEIGEHQLIPSIFTKEEPLLLRNCPFQQVIIKVADPSRPIKYRAVVYRKPDQQPVEYPRWDYKNALFKLKPEFAKDCVKHATSHTSFITKTLNDRN